MRNLRLHHPDFKNSPKINEIIAECDLNIVKLIPFRENYRNLNMLNFLTNKRTQLKNEIDKLTPKKDLTKLLSLESQCRSFQEQVEDCLVEMQQSDSVESITADLDEKNKALLEFRFQLSSACGSFEIDVEEIEKLYTLQMQLDKVEQKLIVCVNYFIELYEAVSLNKKMLSLIYELEEVIRELDDTVLGDFDVLTKKYDDIKGEIKELLGISSHDSLMSAAELKKKYGQKKFSAWEEAIYENYSAETKNKNAEPEDYINYLLRIGSEFLPQQYIELNTEFTSEQRFPSSRNNRHASGFAHLQDCKGDFESENKWSGLLASAAPAKNLFMQNEKILQKFLGMLFDTNVEHILELGISSTRLDYKSVRIDEYTTEIDTNEGIILLTKIKSKEKKVIKFAHISVEDQKPLNLSNDELTLLLEVYATYKQGAVLVHCDSGVGRTGQVRLLFSLLDYLSNNKKTHEKIIFSIRAIVDNAKIDFEEIKNLFTTLYFEMHTILKQLRKTRYCIEAEKQFSGSFGQLLLLIATDQQYNDEEKDILRKKLDIDILILSGNLISIDHAELLESTEGSQLSSSTSNEECEYRTVQKPQFEYTPRVCAAEPRQRNVTFFSETPIKFATSSDEGNKLQNPTLSPHPPSASIKFHRPNSTAHITQKSTEEIMIQP